MPMLQRVQDQFSKNTTITVNSEQVRVQYVCTLWIVVPEDAFSWRCNAHHPPVLEQHSEYFVSVTKTYLVVVRGLGVVRGEDLIQRCWYMVSTTQRKGDEDHTYTTQFRFMGGQEGDDGAQTAQASLVLAQTNSSVNLSLNLDKGNTGWSRGRRF
mmetsp:Transcript_4079/g.4755  ORF Transcript_4079/g.4755 Transcript_4079/m.4755 type:complete len:155 (+) Transcript_4079:203-667(+)